MSEVLLLVFGTLYFLIVARVVHVVVDAVANFRARPPGPPAEPTDAPEPRRRP